MTFFRSRKRLFTICASALALVIIVAAVLALAAAPVKKVTSNVHASSTTTATHSAKATAPTGNGPAKGLTDNPAYQWWQWPNNPQPDSWWGTSQTEATLGQQIDLMSQLGVQLFRVELVWSFVAPQQPGGTAYSSAMARDPNWSGYHWDRWDLIVRLATAAGMQVVPMVVYTPDWASGIHTTTSGGGPNDPPLSAQYYADFMTAVTTRYKDRIHYWELWNEPDYAPHTWNGTFTQWVQLVLKPGYQAVKAVDPTARVVLGGLAGDTNLGAVYEAGGGPYFDIASFHAYYPIAVADSTAWDHIRSALATNGQSQKPIWLTEFGQPTQAPGAPGATPSAQSATAEQAQANLIKGVYGGLKVQAIFFYQLHDTAVYNSSGQIVKLVYWGLVTHDFSHRKAGFQAYASVPEGALSASPQAASVRYSFPRPMRERGSESEARADPWQSRLCLASARL